MSDKGIIFSAPMVRALLEGRKTQTRRLLNPQPSNECSGFQRVFKEPPYFEARDAAGNPCSPFPEGQHFRSPYPRILYRTGDRLYVREACYATELADDDGRDGVSYLADDEFVPVENSEAAAERWSALFHYGLKAGEDPERMRGKSVPSIHMPRWASRLWLEVTDVRVQRLRDIDEKDAAAEGVERHPAAPNHLWKSYGHDLNPAATPRESFRCLWNSLHTKPGETWADNPWIVAVTFDVAHGNIDRIAA